MRAILLNLILGSLLAGCVSSNVKTGALGNSGDRHYKEEECFRKIVDDRTYGKEVRPEELLAYAGGEWKARQVRFFQKMSDGKSPATYFAYAIERKDKSKDFSQFNTKATLLCVSSPEYKPLENSIIFITSFDAVAGYFNEVAGTKASLDQYSIFNSTTWYSEKKGNFLKEVDQMSGVGFETIAYLLTSKDADLRTNAKRTIQGHQIEISSSVSYELIPLK